jgi:hypothetical protein
MHGLGQLGLPAETEINNYYLSIINLYNFICNSASSNPPISTWFLVTPLLSLFHTIFPTCFSALRHVPLFLDVAQLLSDFDKDVVTVSIPCFRSKDTRSEALFNNCDCTDEFHGLNPILLQSAARRM